MDREDEVGWAEATMPADSHGVKGTHVTADLAVRAASRYQVLDELARGGTGRIVRSRDLVFDRIVAVKEPLDPVRGGDRLRAEAAILASLQHPSIVPIYDHGTRVDGVPFFSMKLVEGRSLRDAIRGAPTLAQRLALIPQVVAVAEAVAYAHSRGVIHRDLKPANVLVGEYGETIVIDWGLAKVIGDEPGHDGAGGAAGALAPTLSATQTGAIMGTPAYMAPEQARGEQVDARTDVYALGAMLFHLLTGAAPYVGSDNVVDAVLTGSSDPLGELARPAARGEPVLPPELIAIVKRAMDRDPVRRYPSAGEVASELRRYLTGHLVTAHSYSAWALARRWLRRYRLGVAVAAVALALIVVQGAIGVRRIAVARTEAELRRDALTLLQARGSLRKDPTLAVAWLKQYPPGGADWPAARSIAADAIDSGVAAHVFRRTQLARASADGRLVVLHGQPVLRVWRDGVLRELAVPDAMLSAVALSPDARTIAVFSRDGTLRLVPADGGPIRTLWSAGADGAIVGTARFSPGGDRLAVLAARDQVWLFALDGRPPRRFEARSMVHDVAFSRDGRWLAAATLDKVALVWSVEDGTERTLSGHASEVRALAFAPDGKHLATASLDATVRVWPLAGGEPRVLQGHAGRVLAVGFLADGRVVSGGEDGTVRVWAADGQGRVVTRHASGGVVDIAVSSAGARVASAGEDQVARVTDVDGGDRWALRGHDGPILHVELVGGGHRVLSWGFDNVARVWDLRPLPRRTVLEAAEPISAVAWSPGGEWLAVAGRDRTVRVCVASASCRVLGSHDAPVLSLAIAPDGTAVAAGSADGDLRLWTVATGAARKLIGHRAAVKRLAFARDGGALASGGEERAVWWWDVASGTGRPVLEFDDVVTWVGMAPEGGRLAAASLDGTVRVWSRDGRVDTLRGHGDWVLSAAFSPDGRHLASAGWDGTVRLWSDGQGRVIGRHDKGVASVAFSPDGRWLASGSTDKTARLWDLSTGASRVLRGHEANLRPIAFSPDGRSLATASDDATVRLWDVATGESRVLRGHDGIIGTLAWSPDGTTLVTGSADRTVRRWQLAALAALAHDPRAAHEQLARTTSAALDATDAEAATR